MQLEEGMGDKEVGALLKILAMTWGRQLGQWSKGSVPSKKNFIKMGVIRACLNANGNDSVEKGIFKM